MGNENSSSSSAAATAVFKARGPGNVSGRTRAIMVDAADPTGNTLAASIGGGIRGIIATTFIMEWENLSQTSKTSILYLWHNLPPIQM